MTSTDQAMRTTQNPRDSPGPPGRPESPGLHIFAKVLAACTVLLVLAGSLVTSTASGLSVPDWPTTYGWNMFTFPPSHWVGGILYEHSHRLIASTVGFLTIILAAWLWVTEPRRWMKWLGVAALGAVIAQGVLGGLTVMFFLPASISTAHAGLAEIFFCMTVAIALFTSPGWIDGDVSSKGHIADDTTLRTLATTTTVLIYCQILVGATMRHTGAGLAIPDFPLMFGGIVPDHWSPAIAVHFAHRLGAIVVAGSVTATAAAAWSQPRPDRELTRPAAIILALVLATSLVITLRTWREGFGIPLVRLKPDTTDAFASAPSLSGSVRLQPDQNPGHALPRLDHRGCA